MKKTAITLTIAMLLASAFLTTPAFATPTKTYGTVQHPIADFNNQISSGIVILDFFATWCPPCQRFSPIFTKAATVHTDILFIKVDVDAYAKHASTFNVRSMPTIIALKDGKVIKTKTGFMNAATFNNWIAGLR